MTQVRQVVTGFERQPASRSGICAASVNSCMKSDYLIRIKPYLGGEQFDIISPGDDPGSPWVIMQAVLDRLHGPILPVGVMQDWLETQPNVVKTRANTYLADRARAELFRVWFS